MIRMTGMRRLGGVWVALGIVLGLGCGGGGDEQPAVPVAPEPAVAVSVTAVDYSSITRLVEQHRVSRTQTQRGFACGWHAGWMAAIGVARGEGPRDFRGHAIGTAFGWGVIAVVIGFGGTLVLAFALPRLRRSPKKQVREIPEGVRPSWGVYFKDLVVRLMARVGRALRVEQFDPLLASERQRAIESCRDTERQLAIAIESLASFSVERPERATKFSATLDEWRSEAMALRRRLDGPGSLPRELAADLIGPRIEVMLRAARDLRLRIERTAIHRQLAMGAAESQQAVDTRWTGLEHELGQRPETPRDRHATLSAELAPWVRTTGLVGVGAIGLALPMMAAWMAAGAFPLFFALLFALGGLGAVVTARVHLHRAGRLPLLPGFADRVAGWLTGVCAVVLAVVMGSSWMSTESGLDMGDPPPVMMPDPRLIEAPLIWKDVELYPTRAVAPAPKPAGDGESPGAEPGGGAPGGGAPYASTTPSPSLWP